MSSVISSSIKGILIHGHIWEGEVFPSFPWRITCYSTFFLIAFFVSVSQTIQNPILYCMYNYYVYRFYFISPPPSRHSLAKCYESCVLRW